MADKTEVEYWLNGPLEGVPALLQPVAHALLQAQRELKNAMENFDENLVWQQLAGMASVGFHLQHITGVLSRLFAYAGGNQLTQLQLAYLKEEGIQKPGITKNTLLQNLENQVAACIHFLKTTDTNTLTDARFVGRKLVPSTLIGLLFHSAEHTMRHTGQLLVTAKVLTA